MSQIDQALYVARRIADALEWYAEVAYLQQQGSTDPSLPKPPHMRL